MSEFSPNDVQTKRRLSPRAGVTLQCETLTLTLEAEIGQGQEGTVWLALGQQVQQVQQAQQVQQVQQVRLAVKFLAETRRNESQSEAHFVRTANEVRTRLKEVPHVCRPRRVVAVSDYGPWYAMDYVGRMLSPADSADVSQQNLRDYLLHQKDSGSPLTAAQLGSYLRPVAKALDETHGKHILHCDVNPKNLLVRSHGLSAVQVILINFGEALILDAATTTVQPGQWPRGGTVGYISPERRNGQEQSGYSDQYSLAATLLELCLGQTIDADGDTRLTSPLTATVADEDAVRDVLYKGLRSAPEQRYPTCEALLVAFERVVSTDLPLTGRMLKQVRGLQRRKPRQSDPVSPFWKRPDFIQWPSNNPLRNHQIAQERFAQLQQERQQLQLRLDTLLQSPVRVGLVGTPAAGKTSMLAVWWLFRNSQADQVDLVIKEELTTRYLTTISDTLLARGSTMANPVVPPNYLRMRATIHNESWHLHTCDFAGEFLNFETNSDSDHAAATLAFLRQADMILFLYDIELQQQAERDGDQQGQGDRDREQQRILDTIDRLFVDTPAELVLALTKIDQYWDYKKDPDGFQAAYYELRRKSVSLQLVDTKLSTSFANNGLKIIPVSSYGKVLKEKAGVDQRVYKRDIEPFQIFSPLSAAFQRRADTVNTLREQLEDLQTITSKMETRLRVAAAAADDRQRHLDSLEKELLAIGKSIHEAEQLPSEVGREQALKKDLKKLEARREKLEKYQATTLHQQCIDLIRRADDLLSKLPVVKRSQQLKNKLQILKDINQKPAWEFFIEWFRVSRTVNEFVDESDGTGVPDHLRKEFNEQQRLYRVRSLQITGVIIGTIVTGFLILLSI